MNLPRTFKAIQNPRPEAIYIACGDPRFQEAFEEFPIEALGLPMGSFVPIKNGGGPTPLAYPTEMPSRCKGMIRQILFFAEDKFPSIERVIMIAHGNCGYYSTVPHQCRDQGTGKEKRDLPLAGSLVQMTFPRLHVELYYAELIRGGSEVAFEEVQISKEVRTPLPEWTRSYQLSS